jgi:hypothetical protein
MLAQLVKWKIHFQFVSLVSWKESKTQPCSFFHRNFRRKRLISAQGAAAENPHETIHEHVGINYDKQTFGSQYS